MCIFKIAFILLIILISKQINETVSQQQPSSKLAYYQPHVYEGSLQPKEFQLQPHLNLDINYQPIYNVIELNIASDAQNSKIKNFNKDLCTTNQRRVNPMEKGKGFDLLERFKDDMPLVADIEIVKDKVFVLDYDLDLYVFKVNITDPTTQFQFVQMQSVPGKGKKHAKPQILYATTYYFIILGDDAAFSYNTNLNLYQQLPNFIPSSYYFKQAIIFQDALILATSLSIDTYRFSVGDTSLQLDYVKPSVDINEQYGTTLQIHDIALLHDVYGDKTNQLAVLANQNILFFALDFTSNSMLTYLSNYVLDNTEPQMLAARQQTDGSWLMYATGLLINTGKRVATYFAKELVYYQKDKQWTLEITRESTQETNIKRIYLTNHYAFFLGDNIHYIFYHGISQAFVKDESHVINQFLLVGLQEIIIFRDLNGVVGTRDYSDPDQDSYYQAEQINKNHFMVAALSSKLALFELLEEDANIFCTKQDTAEQYGAAFAYKVEVKVSKCTAKQDSSDNSPLNPCILHQDIQIGLKENFLHQLGSSKSALIWTIVVIVALIIVCVIAGALYLRYHQREVSHLHNEIKSLKNQKFHQFTNVTEQDSKTGQPVQQYESPSIEMQKA